MLLEVDAAVWQRLRFSSACRGGVPSHQRAGSGPQRTMSGPQQAPKSSGSKRMRREAREESPDYVPQPSKRKRERGPSPPPPRIEPAAAVQSPTADAATADVPEEVRTAVQRCHHRHSFSLCLGPLLVRTEDSGL